jgi:hypothetical protein
MFNHFFLFFRYWNAALCSTKLHWSFMKHKRRVDAWSWGGRPCLNCGPLPRRPVQNRVRVKLVSSAIVDRFSNKRSKMRSRDGIFLLPGCRLNNTSWVIPWHLFSWSHKVIHVHEFKVKCRW